MISGVVLAAGASSRMGRPKLAIQLLGRTLLSYALDSFLRSGVDEIIMVVREGQEVPPEPDSDARVRLVVNPDWREGMSSSLKAGIRSVKGEAAVVGLGDQPLLRPSTIDELIRKYRATAARIVVPVFDSRRGNPVLFDRSLFPQILKLGGDVGAKSLIDQNTGALAEVLVDDPGVVMDVDLPSDLERIEFELARRRSGGEGEPGE